jgi:hypothetical protein
MNFIAENNQVLEVLSNNESLISSELKKISIYYQDNGLVIDLNISLIYSKKMKNILLQFIEVSEYSLKYTLDNFFYNIEEYKFYEEKGTFYISLDPNYSVNIERDKNDNDYIVSSKIVLYTT